MTKLQTTKQKQAEISYRIQLHEGKYRREEPSEKELLKELRNRNQNTKRDFQTLKSKGILLSPFLEIGAERGQRAMLLSSEFRETGVMLDLSFDSLKQSKQLK